MYCEDTSTSSEDETSAAATSTTTRTSAADMCRTVIRNRVKVVSCTGCGYTSDRRANVTRHYRRIHGELKKNRQCACGDVFHTKWEFYEHCDEYHPNIRQSWYTTTHVYKLKQTKAKNKLKTTDKPVTSCVSNSERVREGLPTRASSRRLRSNTLSTSNTDTDKENQTSSSFDSSFSEENCSPSFAHLPIKKRYLLSSRSILGNITNNNVEVQVMSESVDTNNNPVSVRDLYLLNIDEKQRAFIDHIDFEELDVILKLRDMAKSSDHSIF